MMRRYHIKLLICSRFYRHQTNLSNFYKIIHNVLRCTFCNVPEYTLVHYSKVSGRASSGCSRQMAQGLSGVTQGRGLNVGQEGLVC